MRPACLTLLMVTTNGKVIGEKSQVIDLDQPVPVEVKLSTTTAHPVIGYATLSEAQAAGHYKGV